MSMTCEMGTCGSLSDGTEFVGADVTTDEFRALAVKHARSSGEYCTTITSANGRAPSALVPLGNASAEISIVVRSVAAGDSDCRICVATWAAASANTRWPRKVALGV